MIDIRQDSMNRRGETPFIMWGIVSSTSFSDYFFAFFAAILGTTSSPKLSSYSPKGSSNHIGPSPSSSSSASSSFFFS